MESISETSPGADHDERAAARRRVWLAEVPIHGTVYVALDNLNSAIILADRQLNHELDQQSTLGLPRPR